MADDAVALAIRLEARFDKLERDLKKVGALADTAVKDAESKFAAFNPSFNFLTGIFQGIGQELFKQLNPATLIKSLVDVNTKLAEIGDTAKRVGEDVESLQAIRFSVASRSSLGTEEFLKDVKDFAKLLQEARKDEGDLVELFKANGKAWKDTKGEVIGMRDALAIVADLTRNAKTELDKFKIAEKVSLTKEWVPAIEQGGAAFEAAARHAEETGAVISREIIEKAREFRTRWNAALEGFTTRAQAGMSELIGLVDQLINKSGPFRELWLVISGLIEQTAAHFFAIANGIDAISTAQARALLASKVYDEATNEALKQRIELNERDEASRARAAGIGARPRITIRPQFNQKGTTIPDDSSSKETKDAFDKATESINKRTAALLADKAAVGLAAGAQEQFRSELKLLEAAQREDTDITDAMITKYAELRREMSASDALRKASIELTDEQSKKFENATVRIGQASAALAAAKTSFQGTQDALRFAGGQLVDVLDQATQKGFNFQQTMQSVLRNVTKQLLQAAITGEGAFAKMLGLSSSVPGGVGGLLGLFSGFKSGGGVTLLPQPGTAGLSGFARGGHIAPGEWAMAGENGPEPVFGGRTGVTVVPNSARGGMNFSPTTIVDARGSTLSTAEVESIVARGNMALARQIDKNFGSRTQKLASLGT